MKYDIFISYRREGGYDTAKHLNDLLVRDGYRVSFDIDTLGDGDFDVQLLERIEQCKDFILIIDKHCFDRTLDKEFDPNKDWVRCELAYALKQNKNIIPVLLSDVKDFPEGLPDDVKGVIRKNGPEYNKYYFNDFYKKLCSKFLKSRSIKKRIKVGLLVLALIITSLILFTMQKTQNEIVYYIDPMAPHTTNEIEMNKYIHDKLNKAIDSLEFSNENSAKTYWENDAYEDSKVYLGMCYMVGYGCSPNINKAIKYLSKIANQGNATAQYLMGVCYDNGIGVKKDRERATEFYLEAAEHGIVEAQCDYGIACACRNKQYEAIEWISKAAERGMVKAQYTLGWYYGSIGNTDDANEWMEKAAEQGDTLAHIALANYYSQVYHYLDEDVFNTYEWLAEENNPIAQYGLAQCYYKGFGTEVDVDLAIKYLYKSAEQGYAPAIHDLGNLYLQGIDNYPQNFNLAMEYFKQAAEIGFPIAQIMIGKMYENGWGVKKNFKKAKKWYEKAERQGVSLQQMQLMQQMQNQQ